MTQGANAPAQSIAPSVSAEVPVPKAQPPKPAKGLSGSGYTRIPNGKLVKNKRPAQKPMPMRQAKNWRLKATTALVSFLKEAGVSKDDPKPLTNQRYQQLVADLAYAKAFYAYVRETNEPVEVQDWRSSNPLETLVQGDPMDQDSTDATSEVSQEDSSSMPKAPKPPTGGASLRGGRGNKTPSGTRPVTRAVSSVGWEPSTGSQDETSSSADKPTASNPKWVGGKSTESW